MGVLTIEEQGNKVCRETDGLQSVTVELQSAPVWSVELIKWTTECRNREVDLMLNIFKLFTLKYRSLDHEGSSETICWTKALMI